MESVIRKPFEGVTNILKFNWHFYAFALALIAGLQLFRTFYAPEHTLFIGGLQLCIALSTLLSLAASWYIYDFSGLYTFNWLDPTLPAGNILNVHAGFDETSFLLAGKFPEAQLRVFDFYDPEKHTEVSIKRARKSANVFPGTVPISTTTIPVAANSAGLALAFMAAHEIRDSAERITFFLKLRESLAPDGSIVVVEHLRNLPNFLVYNAGAFHFLPATEWLQTFRNAGLRIEKEVPITPFVKAFYLKKNGNAS